MRDKISSWFLVASLLLSIGMVQQGLAQVDTSGTPGQLRQEESTDYFNKWLTEDVIYIITDDEKEVFGNLTTDEERERFIEQFWRRRDPDLKTSANEFKEEHYRRIAYANEHFTAGRPGWRSDRGKIYIIHGPPHELQESFGGPYERPIYEGGGQTTTYPYQVWRYRNIEGIGPDIELEFVDSTMTGDFRLASNPNEKDAFANVPGIGLTLAEERGLVSKQARFLKDGGGVYYPLLAQRYQDKPFVRFERYAGVTRPQKIQYQDLKDSVEVNVSFNSLPFRFHQDNYRLNEGNCIVPITVEVPNRHLAFEEANGVFSAHLLVYGVVTGLGKEIIKEFEDDLLVSFTAEKYQEGLLGTSVFQKIMVLESGRRVKINVVLKDKKSERIGVLTRAIVPPKYGEEELTTSSLVLSNTILPLSEIPENDEMFVIGDVKVRPSLDRIFTSDRLMGAYFQVYNAAVDQQTLKPALRVKYRLLHQGQQLVEIIEEDGESIQFASSRRIVLIKRFSPAALGVGKYRLQVEIEDLISKQIAITGDEFEIVGQGQVAARN